MTKLKLRSGLFTAAVALGLLGIAPTSPQAADTIKVGSFLSVSGGRV